MRSCLCVVLVGAFNALGCSTSDTSTPAPTSTTAEPSLGCALGVAGASVVAEDTPDGIALSFTSKDKPDELRERVRDAAAQYGPGQGLGLGHSGRHGDGAEHGLKMMQAPAARSVATDIQGGATIRFVPVDPTFIAELRTKLHDRASVMNALTCK
jgi:hypothetical protein